VDNSIILQYQHWWVGMQAVTAAAKFYFYNNDNQLATTATESSCSISMGKCMQAVTVTAKAIIIIATVNRLQ